MWSSRAFIGLLTRLRPALQSVRSPSPAPCAYEHSSRDDLVPLIERALRSLNRPALLASCELTARLPSRIAAICAEWGDTGAAELAPLQRARALRRVFSEAIDRLRPSDDPVLFGGDGPSSLQFQILVEEYVQELPIQSDSVTPQHQREHLVSVSEGSDSRSSLLN